MDERTRVRLWAIVTSAFTTYQKCRNDDSGVGISYAQGQLNTAVLMYAVATRQLSHVVFETLEEMIIDSK